MTELNICRFCGADYDDKFVEIYDKNGYPSKGYKIAANFFNSWFLDLENGNNIKSMCDECWQKINTFYEFQLSVLEKESADTATEHNICHLCKERSEDMTLLYNTNDYPTNACIVTANFFDPKILKPTRNCNDLRGICGGCWVPIIIFYKYQGFVFDKAFYIKARLQWIKDKENGIESYDLTSDNEEEDNTSEVATESNEDCVIVAERNFCRLCGRSSDKFIEIYDKNGCPNEEYKITANYFNSRFLDLQKGNELKAMCSECWSEIFEFYKFQEFLFEKEEDKAFHIKLLDLYRSSEEHNFCRFCGEEFSGHDYADIYDENDKPADWYKVIANLFDSRFLDLDNGNYIRKICGECFFKISTFQKFQGYTLKKAFYIKARLQWIRDKENGIESYDLTSDNENENNAIENHGSDLNKSITEPNVCRFCGMEYSNSDLSVEIYDKNCHPSKGYKVIANYVNSKFLDLQNGNGLKRMCCDCWDNIFRFYQFHGSVLEKHSFEITDPNICRLCHDHSNDFVEMYDNDNYPSDACTCITEFFSPRFLKLGDYNGIKRICMYCWGNFLIFSKFRTFILKEATYVKARWQRIKDQARGITSYDVSGDNVIAIVENINPTMSSDDDSSSSDMEVDEDTSVVFSLSDSNSESESLYSNSASSISTKSSKNDKPKNNAKESRYNLRKKHFDKSQRKHSKIQYDTNIAKDRTSLSSQQPVEQSQRKDCTQKTQQSSVLNFIKLNYRNPKDCDDLIAQWLPNLKCFACRREFSTFTLLKEHFQKNHTNKRFYVKCCQRMFSSHYNLAEHVCLHIDPSVFKCGECGRFFMYRENLIAHQKVHLKASEECTVN
ncbi:uncharacterized protein [Musca autumnalis]|uniref:uncharacterized protein n=1 Tax=Musca autumnalis TaxID=221902 RepID=UPI003CF090DF